MIPSDTPRTDERACHPSNGVEYVHASFARELERELASTNRLLHDSLAREDRFYCELADAQASLALFIDSSAFLHAESNYLHSEIKNLRAAASTLTKRLREIAEDEDYKAVWFHYANHGGHYKGPFYVDELVALETELSKEFKHEKE